jgi:hypothetical protein
LHVRFRIPEWEIVMHSARLFCARAPKWQFLLAAVALVFGGIAGTPAARATVIDMAAANAAGRLVTLQQPNGSWPQDPNFADNQGPLLVGMMQSYSNSNNASYLTSAQNSGTFIINNAPTFATPPASPNFLGDETYGLTRLGAVQPTYLAPVIQYYNISVPAQSGGTGGYADRLVNHYTTTFNDESQAAIYLAYHAVAANAINATDRAVWRQKLIDTLGKVDDNDFFPVGALGAGVWALAQTGTGLDNTTITGTSSVLNGKQLSQLPAFLTSQIVPSGGNANTFFFDFAHTQSGFTEDTAFGLLGMEAANAANPGLGLASTILNGETALTNAVDANGLTYVDVSKNAPAYNVYAGRFLQAVPEPTSAGAILIFVAGLMGQRRGQRGAK